MDEVFCKLSFHINLCEWIIDKRKSLKLREMSVDVLLRMLEETPLLSVLSYTLPLSSIPLQELLETGKLPHY